MAFHVACPITSRRICFCSLGFPRKLQSEKARNEFLDEVARLEEFLKDPWLLRAKEKGTVQVAVPKVVVPPPPAAVGDGDGDGGGGGTGVDGEELLSAQTKRAAMQKKAATASLVAEDYAPRFESGDLVDASKDLTGEEQGQSNVKVMCRLCFLGENEGSKRARRMLSCKSCGKKYHRSCLKSWAQHRDLFHWSSWNCPSCRICEVCRRTGDSNKFMFCKRCDGAYHCYCQQPPHKNVSSGPYLCPKHTRCHSCGSTVPGNGLSTRWFLGYTCCDACGRLFVKGNYCPVCLKVYRDSESTPMVCCDVCQRWVHCQCDGISDEKYLQFQVDGNLQYKCATCRGECYKVRDLEDAVQELWGRRDKTDRDLIASLRAAAGLPTQEEIFSISPDSDDEENDPILLKNEYSRSLKFSLKGLVDKSPKKAKEYGQRSTNKKNIMKKGYQPSLIGKTEAHQSFEGHSDAQSFGYSMGDDMQSCRSEHISFPVAGSLTEGICSINQAGVLKHKFIDEVGMSNEDRKSRMVQMKSNKPHGVEIGDDIGKNAGKSKTTKGPKLVIHLGARNRNVTNSPGSDASSYQREQDLTTFNGREDTGQQRSGDKHMLDRHDATAKFGNGKGDEVDYSDQLKGSKFRGRESNLIKIRKINSEVSAMKPKLGGGNVADGCESVSPVNPRVSLGKSSTEGGTTAIGTITEVPAITVDKVSLRSYAEGSPDVSGDQIYDNARTPLVSHSLPKDSKPLLKLKFKHPYHENQSSHSHGEDEKSSVKGQRTKRKRPSPFVDKTSAKEDEDTSQWYDDNTMNEILDANWILQKLGKDAIGKKVEVHQPSDNSWHRGMIMDFIGTSVVSVALDDGRAKKLELGKQGIRFVSQKQKRSYTIAKFSRQAARLPHRSPGERRLSILSSNIFYGNSTKSRKLYAYYQKHQLHREPVMVAGRYYPPWFSVAPMMEWTNTHYRTLARLISKHAWLYTEMIAAETIVYQKGNLDRFLAYTPEQHPIVLQIGGSNLENLAKATELANDYGYDEINFNCGCPSPKVAGHGCFGVRLMLDPKFVAEAMSVIAANSDAPVSVKCRIGVDDHDSYNELCDFIYKVSSQSPARHFIIHSRKALLNGISPADNRKIPPLKYEYYFALLRDFPDLRFTINGGINGIDEVNAAHKEGAHGVMVGRASYHNPWYTLGHVDTAVYGAPCSGLTRRQVLEQYQVYGDSVLGKYGSNRPNIRDVAKVGYNFLILFGKTFYFSLRSRWSDKHKTELVQCDISCSSSF
ncbi:hypothetical protein F0562_018719 [Nyssa sinensis]|uniref:PHD-type domain-containing protein n=1 Tax=Nyssa sinensis TaxID=561372 RepID=A0A5J4ZB80_9ASTE|nr:hypothetical protein F0562_018719 [Nyssa sinensis]